MIALNALGVLLAYLMILTPLAFADLVSDTPTTIASSAATKVEMTGSLVTRDTDKSYLTVISAARNLNNPTPGTQYIYDESAGAGTTIFVIDSGFNTANYEDEFCTDNGRWFETYAIPREIRSEMLTDREREAGVHFPPDDMADIGGIGSDNLIHGHGTHVAIAAAGCKSGVAPRANLVLIKATEIKLNREGQIDASGRSSVYPQALIASLQFVIQRMQDTRGQEIPLGKAVVLLPFSLVIRNMGDDWGSDQLELFERDMNSTLSQLDAHGMSVVLPGSDSGHGQGKEDSGPDAKSDDYPYYTSELFPQSLSLYQDFVILVGGTDEEGRLRPQSSPDDPYRPISIYAPSKILGYDIATNKTRYLYGTSFAAAQVAGLVAYSLGHPNNTEIFSYSVHDPLHNIVGSRAKKYVAQLAYQRLRDEYKLASPRHDYLYPVNDEINVAYNGTHGVQRD